MVTVVVTAEASTAELQTEVRVSDRLTLAGTDVSRQTRHHHVTTLQVSSNTTHIFVAAQIPIRSRLCTADTHIDTSTITDCRLLVAQLFQLPAPHVEFTDMECPPGRRDISRIIDHISSPPRDTPVQEVFS